MRKGLRVAKFELGGEEGNGVVCATSKTNNKFIDNIGCYCKTQKPLCILVFTPLMSPSERFPTIKRKSSVPVLSLYSIDNVYVAFGKVFSKMFYVPFAAYFDTTIDNTK